MIEVEKGEKGRDRDEERGRGRKGIRERERKKKLHVEQAQFVLCSLGAACGPKP